MRVVKNRTIGELVPPARWRILLELQAAAELVNLGLRYHGLTRNRVAYENPIILFPGFGTSEMSLALLNGYLKRTGAEVFDWGIGLNHGYVPNLLRDLVKQVRTLASQRGKKLHLVGWSLGGYLAREVAREVPHLTAKIATLGTPVVGGPKYTAIARMYAQWGFDVEAMARDAAEREKIPIKNEILAIFSKNDNVVSWQACIDRVSPDVRHEEVNGSHLGLVVNAQAYRLIRDFLSM